MKRVLFLVSLITLSFHQHGVAAKQNVSSAEMDLYLKVQEALASDSLKTAKKSAADLAKNTKSQEVKRSAKAISSANSLGSARTSFKDLSVPFVKSASEVKTKGIEVYTCPMAKADWVQKTGDTANPYYGKEMASCGERKVNAEIKK